MPFFNWDQSLDVGVDQMNEQHKKLVGLMDILSQNSLAGVSKEGLMSGCQELVDAVTKHFKDEENYMESIAFPFLEAHKNSHVKLLADLNQLLEDFKNSTGSQSNEKFLNFFNVWILTHIRGIDMLYGTHPGETDIGRNAK